jgi:predicted NAD/FAD-dependent oxidoreductase
MSKSGPVAIIGAGISGLSCAQALRSADIEVRLFERAARVGGRCATVLWQGHLVDHGVQYFTAETPEFKRELLTRLRQFRPIIPPILNQDRKIVISAAGPRFYVLQGNNYFAQVLSQGLDVRLNTSVETLTFRGGGVECCGENFRAIVSSLPAPQTARLFQLAEKPPDYVCGLTVLLEFSGLNVGDSRDCYARLLPGESEPLAASYCENHKSGRIIGNKTVFVAQAGPRFSTTYADAPPDDYIDQLIRAQEELWGIPAGKCTATFPHRWRLSRPQDGPRHPFAPPPGAFICGDARCESTVEDVWLDGRKAAQEVIEYLDAGTPGS